ncbi:MAG: hypothetical protein AAGI07_12770 [Bacteroidota bacterium]
MRVIFTVLLLVLFVSEITFSQNFNDEKEDISVLPFGGWQGNDAEVYEKIITEKILALIIDSRKFNVITSDDDELKRIANELRIQLSGMVDESTAVEIGKRRGVKLFIVGNFTGNAAEYHRPTYNGDGELQEDSYYSARISANIKLMEIETGKYTTSTSASALGKSSSQRGAINKALDRLASEIYENFRKYFLVQAYISGVNHSEIILDRGAELGVKEGMTFEILDIVKDNGKIRSDVDIPVGTTRIGIIKITGAENASARGLLMGPYKELMPGYLVREMVDAAKTSATIVDKTLNKVTINRGQNFEIKSGQYFTVLKSTKKSSQTGRIKKVGLIHINETGEDYAVGKILKGRYAFKEGMIVEQTKGTPFIVGASYSYGVALNQRTVAPSLPSGTQSVNNGEPGLVSIETDYLENYKNLSTAEVHTFNAHFRDLLYNYTISLGMDFYSIGDGELNAWVPKLGASYQIPIVPEVLYISPGVEAGYGRMRQNFTEVNQLSAQESDFIQDWSPMIGASLEGTLRIRNVLLFANVSYRHLRFTSWKYRAETGELDDDGDPETKFYSIPDSMTPYPRIKLGPVFTQIGLRIEVPVR